MKEFIKYAFGVANMAIKMRPITVEIATDNEEEREE